MNDKRNGNHYFHRPNRAFLLKLCLLLLPVLVATGFSFYSLAGKDGSGRPVSRSMPANAGTVRPAEMTPLHGASDQTPLLLADPRARLFSHIPPNKNPITGATSTEMGGRSVDLDRENLTGRPSPPYSASDYRES